MITLFRRIRQKLIDSGSVTKYMLYALGEILLVVVGILIALQVNNWNEERNDRRMELKLLSQIQSDLQTTSADTEELYNRLEISSNSADSLLQSFRTGRKVRSFVFHASLIHRRFFFNPATSGYAQLGTSSGAVIQNDALRNRIVEIYEEDFEEISKRQELLSDHMNQSLFPLSRSRFNLNRQITFKMSDFDENSMDFYEPLSFELLVRDTEYANSIVIQKRLYTIQLNQLEKTLDRINGTLKRIEEEVEKG